MIKLLTSKMFDYKDVLFEIVCSTRQIVFHLKKTINRLNGEHRLYHLTTYKKRIKFNN